MAKLSGLTASFLVEFLCDEDGGFMNSPCANKVIAAADKLGHDVQDLKKELEKSKKREEAKKEENLKLHKKLKRLKQIRQCSAHDYDGKDDGREKCEAL
jgi:hypothetical protein